MAGVAGLLAAMSILTLLGLAVLDRFRGASLQRQAGTASIGVGLGVGLFAGEFPSEFRIVAATLGFVLVNVGGYAYYRDVRRTASDARRTANRYDESR